MDLPIRPRLPSDPPLEPCPFTEAQSLAADIAYLDMKVSGRLAEMEMRQAAALEDRMAGERA